MGSVTSVTGNLPRAVRRLLIETLFRGQRKRGLHTPASKSHFDWPRRSPLTEHHSAVGALRLTAAGAPRLIALAGIVRLRLFHGSKQVNLHWLAMPCRSPFSTRELH
jgi:hypothetical protein